MSQIPEIPIKTAEDEITETIKRFVNPVTEHRQNPNKKFTYSIKHAGL